MDLPYIDRDMVRGWLSEAVTQVFLERQKQEVERCKTLGLNAPSFDIKEFWRGQAVAAGRLTAKAIELLLCGEEEEDVEMPE